MFQAMRNVADHPGETSEGVRPKDGKRAQDSLVKRDLLWPATAFLGTNRVRLFVLPDYGFEALGHRALSDDLPAWS